MPWWVIALCVIGFIGLGAFLGACGMLLYIGKGMWQ
jgi:hypothetical protein